VRRSSGGGPMGRLMALLLFALAGALQGQPASAAGDRMLVFTRTAGYRHDSIPAAVAAIRDLAARHGIEVDHTEDAAVFRPDNLARFKAVSFVNATGNVLDRAQQRAFEAFVEAGGGYLGIHSAADTGYDWPWYGQLLGGAVQESSARPADRRSALRSSTRRPRPARVAGHGRVLRFREPPERRGDGDRAPRREHLRRRPDGRGASDCVVPEGSRRPVLVYRPRASPGAVCRSGLSRPPRQRRALCHVPVRGLLALEHDGDERSSRRAEVGGPG